MNEKLKYLTLFVIGMMLSLGMNAQSVKSISGTVTDDQGEAVISGTVKVKNGSIGTITDINGKYTLSVPSNATLVFSYIGYITPATLPFNPSSALKDCAFSMSLPLAVEIEPVKSDLRIVP